MTGDLPPHSKRRKDFFALRKMMMSKIRPWNYVIVAEKTRWCRSYHDNYYDELKKNNVIVISCNESENSDFGIDLTQIQSKIELYSASTRIKRVHTARIKEGLINNRLPFGYSINRKTKKIKLLSGDCDIVKTCFEMLSKEHTIAQIRDYLIQTYKRDFTFHIIKIITQNQTYLGIAKRAIRTNTEIYHMYYKLKRFPLIEGKCVLSDDMFDIFDMYRKLNPETYKGLEASFKTDLKHLKNAQSTKISIIA